MKRTIQTLALVAALTLPWILLQAADGGAGESPQRCKANADGSGCENPDATCITKEGRNGKCTAVVLVSMNPCKCIAED